eukprot:jgi/Mesvir1/13771/Mv01198-RA.1
MRGRWNKAIREFENLTGHKRDELVKDGKLQLTEKDLRTAGMIVNKNFFNNSFPMHEVLLRLENEGEGTAGGVLTQVMPLVDRKNINKAYHAAQDRLDDPDMILHELELRRMIDGHWNPYDRVTNASGVSRPPPDGSAWGHRYFYDQEAERLASDTWDKGWRFAPEFVRGSRHAAIDVHEKMRGIAAKRMDKRALIDNMHLMLPTPDRSADPSAPAHSYGAGLLAVDRATAENTRPYQPDGAPPPPEHVGGGVGSTRMDRPERVGCLLRGRRDERVGRRSQCWTDKAEAKESYARAQEEDDTRI